MNFFLTTFITISILLILVLGFLVIIFIKSNRSMTSLLSLLTRPEKMKINEASRVIRNIMFDEINNIQNLFENLQSKLQKQVNQAEQIKQEFIQQNENINNISNNTIQNMNTMNQRLDNTVLGLRSVVESVEWQSIEKHVDVFLSRVDDLLNKIDLTGQNILDKSVKIQGFVSLWTDVSNKLSNDLENNINKYKSEIQNITDTTDIVKEKIINVSNSILDNFDKIKISASDYAGVIDKNNLLLSDEIKMMQEYTKTAGKEMDAQVSRLVTTANSVGGQIVLSEASISKQINKLTDVVQVLLDSAVKTEEKVKNISSEITGLTNHFNSEINDFSKGITAELLSISNVANNTLDNTRTVANTFSQSVRDMEASVNNTILGMNTANSHLMTQSTGLLKLINETTTQIKPLSDLIEKYYKSMPELINESKGMNSFLEKTIISLNDKIEQIKTTSEKALNEMTNSTQKIGQVSEDSRTQIIEMMGDYSKAVSTMEVLNKQISIARDLTKEGSIKPQKIKENSLLSGTDFINQIPALTEKLHSQALDLTRTLGVDIPDVIWKRYHEGDNMIFSKWLSKLLTESDKKKIKSVLSNDNVFKSQSLQFVRAFKKIYDIAQETDENNLILDKLLSSDLGKIYLTLKPLVL